VLTAGVEAIGYPYEEVVMSEEQKPVEPKEPAKEKKLELNKETIKELEEEDLDKVAGGALGTRGGRCAQQTLAPACPPEPIETVGCAPLPDPPTIIGLTCPEPIQD
jgi:hypothetical protein